MLELRPPGENCNMSLPPETLRAPICKFECTFCADCAETLLDNICPTVVADSPPARSGRE